MSYKKFTLYWFLSILSLFALLFLVLLYLSFIFEHNPYEEIGKRQIKNNSIYGSALNENYFAYRLAMIKIQKPEILAIGSSRVGQFKQKYFKTSFYAAANGANTISEMKLFVNEVLKIYTPKLVILGIDPWWFNRKYPNYKHNTYQTISGKDINAEKIKTMLSLIIQGRLPVLLDFFDNSHLSNPYTPYDSLGIRAILNSDGSFKDGSYLYASTLYGYSKTYNDSKFENTLWRIQNSNSQFVHGNSIEKDRIIELEETIKKLHQNNIQTIVLVAPISNTVYQTIFGEHLSKYYYLEKLGNYLRQKHFYNFLNPKNIQSNDCEFYDGFHGGDIAYARMLQMIEKQDKAFGNYLRLDNIQWNIIHNANRASSDKHRNQLREIDFLQIGCQK